MNPNRALIRLARSNYFIETVRRAKTDPEAEALMHRLVSEAKRQVDTFSMLQFCRNYPQFARLVIENPTRCTDVPEPKPPPKKRGRKKRLET